jgi:hypothetical protein
MVAIKGKPSISNLFFFLLIRSYSMNLSFIYFFTHHYNSCAYRCRRLSLWVCVFRLACMLLLLCWCDDCFPPLRSLSPSILVVFCLVTTDTHTSIIWFYIFFLPFFLSPTIWSPLTCAHHSRFFLSLVIMMLLMMMMIALHIYIYIYLFFSLPSLLWLILSLTIHLFIGQ